MRLISLTLAALLPGAALAQAGDTPAEAPRTLEYALHEDGRLVGAPTIRLEVGRTAALSVSGNYSLRVRIDRAQSAGGAPAYLVRSSLYRPAEPRWALVAQPSLTVLPGEQGALDVSTADGNRLSIGVTVR